MIGCGSPCCCSAAACAAATGCWSPPRRTRQGRPAASWLAAGQAGRGRLRRVGRAGQVGQGRPGWAGWAGQAGQGRAEQGRKGRAGKVVGSLPSGQPDRKPAGWPGCALRAAALRRGTEPWRQVSRESSDAILAAFWMSKLCSWVGASLGFVV